MPAKTLVKYFVVLLFVNLIFIAPVYAQNAPVGINEKFTMGALEKIHGAQATFVSTVGAGNFGSFSQLLNQGFIDAVLASGEKYGYQFSMTVTPSGPGHPFSSFQVSAVPRQYGKSGKRSFYTDLSGLIRGADHGGAPATAADPVVPVLCGESGAIAAMRTINSAEATYQSTAGAGIGYGNLNQLRDQSLIDGYLGKGEKCGYRFWIVTTAPIPPMPATYKAYAVPLQYPITGVRSFYTDQNGVIRGADRGGAPADAEDPPV